MVNVRALSKIFILLIGFFLLSAPILQIISTSSTVSFTSSDPNPNYLTVTLSEPIVGTSNLAEASGSNNQYLLSTRASNNGETELDNLTQYLIITPELFIETIEPLAAWKTQKGVYTKMMPLDGPTGINSTYNGPDLPAKIHAFLREYYNRTPYLKWLLLVGDSEIIPPRKILTNVSTGITEIYVERYCYSDYYYSALDTTWDNNSNQVYGEPGEEDWGPELFVGRLPVNDVSELATAVNKILTYEKNPPGGEWFTRSIQSGALMDRPNVPDDLNTPEDEGYNDYKDNAWEVIKKVIDLLPAFVNASIFLDYDRIPGGTYSKENDTLNENNVLAVFDLGTSTVNFVSKGDDNGVRHYNGNGQGLLELNSEYFFNHNTAKKASNGFKLPLLYTSSCTSVNFTNEDDSNLEQLIISPYGGAIGVIGATTETYRLEFYINDSSYGNWWLDEQFWQKFYSGSGRFRPGEILYKLKEDYYEHFTDTAHNPHPSGIYESLYRINFFSYNLLGDPEVQIYTDVPGEIKVEYDKIFSPIYRDSSLELKVLDKTTGQPVHDADVCLTGDNTYLTTRTDSLGIARFDLELQKDEVLSFTITAHNYRYYENTVRVVAVEDVLISEEGIQFDRNPVPPGTTVNITLTISNHGSSSISDLKINCYADEIASENLINQSIINILPSGNNKNLTFSWPVPPESHNFIVSVDPDDELFELNETNNIAEIMLIENKLPHFITNLPPIPISEDTISEDILNLTQYTHDPDTEDLEYSILNISHPGFNITINNSLISLYPPANWFGNVTAIITVFDGTSNDTEALTIIVNPVNDPPSINNTFDWLVQSENISVTSDRITILEDHIVDITIVAEDLDDATENLRFTAETELFSINSTSGRILFIPVNSQVGEYNINFTVNDSRSENNLGWREVTFEVINVNDPPELILNKTYFQATVGKTFEFSVMGFDPDFNDSIQFSDNTKLFEVDSTTGKVKFKPKDAQIGKHQITITASDGNASDSIIITLEIKSAPEPALQIYLILLCPVILIILILLFLVQEFLNYQRKQKDERTSKERKKKNEKE